MSVSRPPSSCFLVSICVHFVVLLWPDDGPSWGRNWSPLNKHIHRSSLVMIGDLLRSLQEISCALLKEIR